MTQESIQRLDYKPKTPLVDSYVKLIKPRRELILRITGSLREASMFGLLVILAAAESVKHKRAPTHEEIEQLREYGDWVD